MRKSEAPSQQTGALYQRYRPQSFDEIIGQPHIVTTLQNALSPEHPRVSHSYLFCGQRGTGKTTTARLLAKALNCEQGLGPNPCNRCDSCRRIAQGSSMDVLEIDAASHSGVDNVRDHIVEKALYVPAQSRYRVYIIDEVHMLSKEAFNALLKTIEEPPPHAVFVLATTDAHKVPATIQSRCQRMDFRLISVSEVVAHLARVAQREGVEAEQQALLTIARAADGSVRDSLSILEQVMTFCDGTIVAADVNRLLGIIEQELLEELARAIVNQNAMGAVQLVKRAIFEGKDPQLLARQTAHYFRDLMLLSLGCLAAEADLTEEVAQSLKDRFPDLPEWRAAEVVNLMCEAEKEVRDSSQRQLVLELYFYRAASRALTAQGTGAPPQPAVAAAPTRPPQPPSRRAASPTAEGPPANLAAAWPLVLEAVRRQPGGVALKALIVDAQPVSLEKDTAVIRLKGAFHADRLESEGKRQPIEAALSKVFGRPIKAQFEAPASQPDTLPSKMPSSSRGAAFEETEDEVGKVKSLFDATVIDDA